ncbi:dehydrogenase/reductase SDR family member 11 isoform X4 [Myotis daubentonii]|uniref:dehydrogenase/reductase SDR family member 11 isoform X4 n=1 Tax=Myotis daubentonii TaxID=98922 RepID=UPI002873E45D|nr:dehydrogenase/reductase SDR family member 11 isoform X4 [Myotis daubentonii]
MWPTVEERRVESRPQAGQVGGSSRRGLEAGREAAAAVAVGERPSPCDLGPSSAVQVPSSRSEMARGGMERWRDRLALVTGASGGIGAAVARALVQQGLRVVGCARTVGNIEVNVLALSICTREAYQSMKERNVDDGHIININSMSGHRVVPQSVAHFYSATKYAVTALTEGLRQELREAQTHIRATFLSRPSLSAQCISPGLVETQFAFKLHDKDPEKAAATYEHIKCLKPEDVAQAIIYVLSTPPHVQIGDIQMRPTEQVT